MQSILKSWAAVAKIVAIVALTTIPDDTAALLRSMAEVISEGESAVWVLVGALVVWVASDWYRLLWSGRRNLVADARYTPRVAFHWVLLIGLVVLLVVLQAVSLLVELVPQEPPKPSWRNYG